MSTLLKATLQAILPDDSEGPEISVQFNPASMRLQLSNSLEGGASQGHQARQNLGNNSTVLSFDLVFDTADEGTDAKPRSVREKTKAVEQFVLPRGAEEGREAPPKVRFHWGDLIVVGVMESLTLDIDHFSPEGIPLRAKMGVSIRGQDSKYEFAARGKVGPKPGDSSAGPGTSGGGGSDRSGLALAGESAAQFAARMGLDPSAWRGLSLEGGASLEASLSLEAGAELSFSAGLSASAGIGASVGVEAGAAASLDASFGLSAEATAGAGVTAGASADLSAGFALSAAGGLTAALDTVTVLRTEAAANQARTAFQVETVSTRPAVSAGPSAALPAGAAPSSRTAALPAAAVSDVSNGRFPRPSAPDQRRTPLQASATPPATGAGAPAPRPPRPDPRAVSFGFGVPLRPIVQQESDAGGGAVVVHPRPAAQESDETADPTASPWTHLPAVETIVKRGARQNGCGCNGWRDRHRGER